MPVKSCLQRCVYEVDVKLILNHHHFDTQGVLLSHRNLQTNMEGMVTSWRWTSSDVILHVLPLYHIHGIVNVLMTSLYCGATCVMLPAFDAGEVSHYNHGLKQLMSTF